VYPLIGIPCATTLRAKYPTRFYTKRTYCDALAAAGGAPILIPLLDGEEQLLDIFRHLDGLLLSGGGDVRPEYFGEPRLARLIEVDAARDRTELLLTRCAVKERLPILAICRGVQMLNVALAGTLYQDIAEQIPHALRHRLSSDYARNYLAHKVLAEPGTQLADVMGDGPVPVNSFHHQSVREVGSGLRIAARAPDGVVEALEGRDDHFVLGVQWHPEDLYQDDPRMLQVFRRFVEAATHS
jgi:putative glutamine amidotransferase